MKHNVNTPVNKNERGPCGDTPFRDDQHKYNEEYHRTPNRNHGSQGPEVDYNHPLYKR